jgi:hypothetical protein
MLKKQLIPALKDWSRRAKRGKENSLRVYSLQLLQIKIKRMDPTSFSLLPLCDPDCKFL